MMMNYARPWSQTEVEAWIEGQVLLHNDDRTLASDSGVYGPG